jgi:hypothetical protein
MPFRTGGAAQIFRLIEAARLGSTPRIRSSIDATLQTEQRTLPGVRVWAGNRSTYTFMQSPRVPNCGVILPAERDAHTHFAGGSCHVHDVFEATAC